MYVQCIYHAVFRYDTVNIVKCNLFECCADEGPVAV